MQVIEISEERRSAGGDPKYETQKLIKKKKKRAVRRVVNVAGVACRLLFCLLWPSSLCEVGKQVGVRVSGDAFGAEK